MKLKYIGFAALLLLGACQELYDDRIYNALEEEIVDDSNSGHELINPGFELDAEETLTPQGWVKWCPPAKPSSLENAKVVKGDAHSGSYYLSMSGTTGYDINVNQPLNNIPTGKYTLRAWYRSSGGQEYAIVSIKNYGGKELVKMVNGKKSTWTEIVIEDIEITTGKCQIDLYSGNSAAEQWLHFDDVSLTQNKNVIDEPLPGAFRLLWFDEFNGNGSPDLSKWTFENGFIRNEELQYYTNSLNNICQSNGNLEIRVLKDVDGHAYTSGSIVTRGKYEFTYGKIEGRFKMPQGKGLWPCFWTLGANENPVGWPKCGEIDIFEHINSEDQIHSTAHWADEQEQHASSGNTYKLNVEEWHIYSMEWTPKEIKWFVDNVLFHTVNIEGGRNGMNEFHMPHYLLINYAIGGSWPGAPDETTILPATMYCDWVRYYEWVGEGNVPVAKVSLNASSLNLLKSKSFALTSSIIPANATNKQVTWSSSNPSVATVSEQGLVKGVSEGAAVIKAVAKDGSRVMATCDVTVVPIDYTLNYIQNPSFEKDAPSLVGGPVPNWNIWVASGTVKAVQVIAGDANDGNHYLRYGSSSDYGNTYVMQTLNDLPDGNYILKGAYRCSGGQSWAAIVVSDPGYNFTQFSKQDTWKEFTIPINNVTKGTAKIEIFCGDSQASQWIELDNLSMKLQNN